MRKLIISAMATLMILVTGCRFEYDSKDAVMEPAKIEYQAFTDLGSGKLLLTPNLAGGAAVKYLHDLSVDRDYHIVIESFGGSAFDLMSVINRLQELQSLGYHITTETYGYALSAGAAIFMCGDTRIVHDGSILMFHGAGFNTFAGRKSMRSPDSLNEMEKTFIGIMDGEMIKLLIEKTDLTKEEVQNLMYKEDANFISAMRAFKKGIATEIK